MQKVTPNVSGAPSTTVNKVVVTVIGVVPIFVALPLRAILMAVVPGVVAAAAVIVKVAETEAASATSTAVGDEGYSSGTWG